MSHIRALSSLNWVKVAIDDSIEVPGDNLGDFMKLIKIEGFEFLVDILGERNGSEITHRRFVSIGIFNDFCAKVRTLDRTEIFLVRLSVA